MDLSFLSSPNSLTIGIHGTLFLPFLFPWPGLHPAFCCALAINVFEVFFFLLIHEINVIPWGSLMQLRSEERDIWFIEVRRVASFCKSILNLTIVKASSMSMTHRVGWYFPPWEILGGIKYRYLLIITTKQILA